MTELAKATATGCFCHGVAVAKSRGHAGRQYAVVFESEEPASTNGSATCSGVPVANLLSKLKARAARRSVTTKGKDGGNA